MSINTNLNYTITGVVKDDKGEITAYHLDNGDTVMKDEAVNLAKQGAIKGVSVAISKKGEEFLRSLPDGDKSNNLDNLPIMNEEF